MSANVDTKPPMSMLGTLLVRANEGRTFFRGAHSVTILLDGKQTDGKFSSVLVTRSYPKTSLMSKRAQAM
jgi:hypothetical protein